MDLGSRWTVLLFPETIVTPAIFFDLGYTYTLTKLDSFSLKISELQGAILVCKQFKEFQSYAGFRIMPIRGEFKIENNEKIKSKNDNFSLFFGLIASPISWGKVFLNLVLVRRKFFL